MREGKRPSKQSKPLPWKGGYGVWRNGAIRMEKIPLAVFWTPAPHRTLSIPVECVLCTARFMAEIPRSDEANKCLSF